MGEWWPPRGGQMNAGTQATSVITVMMMMMVIMMIMINDHGFPTYLRQVETCHDNQGWECDI